MSRPFRRDAPHFDACLGSRVNGHPTGRLIIVVNVVGESDGPGGGCRGHRRICESGVGGVLLMTRRHWRVGLMLFVGRLSVSLRVVACVIHVPKQSSVSNRRVYACR